MSIFRHFKLLVFIAQKGVFPFQHTVKDIFLNNIALKKGCKNGHIWTKTMGQPLWQNVNFSTFETSSFYCQERRFFNLEYRKSHFFNLQCLKKNVGKMAIFGPKLWVNPFGKMSIFRILELLVFIAYKGAFPFQSIVKVIFLTNIALKKGLEKCPYFDQNHGLTPQKNVNFSTFGTSCFYCLERCFFNLEYRKSNFPNLYCLKKNVQKMAIS